MCRSPSRTPGGTSSPRSTPAGPVAGLRVAVQEYGKPGPDLVAGLRERGAEVVTVPVYRWALPEDTGPLRRAAGRDRRRADQRRAVHLGPAGRPSPPGRRRGRRGADVRGPCAIEWLVGSIGPTTTETLSEDGMQAGLRAGASQDGPPRRRPGRGAGRHEPGEQRIESRESRAVTGSPRRGPGGRNSDRFPDLLRESPFLKACRREPTDVTPGLAHAAGGPLHARISARSGRRSGSSNSARTPSSRARSRSRPPSGWGWTRRSCSPTSC